MIHAWQVDALVELVNKRYPGWAELSHPAFVAEEAGPKRRLAELVQAELGEAPMLALLQAQAYQALVQRVARIGKKSALLYNRTPAQGDLNILMQIGGNSAEFCHQFYHLLHSPKPIGDRLRQWQQFTQQNNLACKWSFTSFFLFFSDPSQHIFIKPRATQWFLQFIGQPNAWSSQVNPQTYQTVVAAAQQLKELLSERGAADLLDVQSVLWIAFRESAQHTPQLALRAQVELDQPPTTYRHITPEPLAVHEDAPAYANMPQVNAPSLTPPMTLDALADALLRDAAIVSTWVDALQRKGQLIFYGPPGTGKTFAAQKLAAYLVNGKDGFIEQLQLHPNYTYEEFVEGLRPVQQDGHIVFRSVPGRFVEFCQRAEQVSGRCVLILDEINRADLARIFGELMLLLEYRNQTITLASGAQFRVPSNICLLGTMNTADRSIALVDYALRRRFAFIELAPNFDVLRRYHAKNQFKIEALIDVLTDLNKLIEPAYQIGSSYFFSPELAKELPIIWKHEIEPYLDEYFYLQKERASAYKWANIAPKLNFQ